MNSVVNMRLGAFLVLLINTLVQGMRRGPHHPPGQNPVDQNHHHYKPRGSESLVGDSDLLHDAKHIEEDSPMLSAADVAKMTYDELEFHYFSAHDFDKNSKLDGLEMLKAIYHTAEHEAQNTEENSEIEPEPFDEFEVYIALVDRTLETDDTDGDGFISYAEYRAARAKQPRGQPARTSRVIAAYHSP